MTPKTTLALAASLAIALATAACSDMGTSTNADAQQALDAREFRVARIHLSELFDAGKADDQTYLIQKDLMLELGDGYGAMAAIDLVSDAALDEAARRTAKAHALILQGKPEEAALLYDDADPADLSEQDFRMVLWSLRELDQEETFALGMDTALDAYPDSADLNALAGAQLVDLGLPEEAMAFADKAIAAEPAHYEALLVLGQIAISNDDLDGALGHYRKANDAYPERAAPLANMAGLQLDMGDLDAAGETLDRAALDHPTDVFLQWQLARYALAKEDFPTARAALEKARRGFRFNDEFTLFSARVEDASGNHRVALSEYQRYLRAVGEDAGVEARIAVLKADIDG